MAVVITGKIRVDHAPLLLNFGYSIRSSIKGRNQIIAKMVLLIKPKTMVIHFSSNSNNPQRAMFKLKINPSNANQMPLFLGWVLINLKMKIGAINMAISIKGTSLLNLVNIKIPKPSRK